MKRLNKTLVAIVIALSFCGLAQAEIDAGDNQPVPDLRWLTGQGEEQHLYAIQNKAKVLHFWASWCIPCREEMPELIQWQKENPDIVVLALSLDQKIAQTNHFIKKNKLDMPALLLNEEDSNALAVPVVPYTLFVSADNRLLGTYPGIAPWLESSFSGSVRELLSK